MKALALSMITLLFASLVLRTDPAYAEISNAFATYENTTFHAQIERQRPTGVIYAFVAGGPETEVVPLDARSRSSGSTLTLDENYTRFLVDGLLSHLNKLYCSDERRALIRYYLEEERARITELKPVLEIRVSGELEQTFKRRPVPPRDATPLRIRMYSKLWKQPCEPTLNGQADRFVYLRDLRRVKLGSNEGVSREKGAERSARLADKAAAARKLIQRRTIARRQALLREYRSNNNTEHAEEVVLTGLERIAKAFKTSGLDGLIASMRSDPRGFQPSPTIGAEIWSCTGEGLIQLSAGQYRLNTGSHNFDAPDEFGGGDNAWLAREVLKDDVFFFRRTVETRRRAYDSVVQTSDFYAIRLKSSASRGPACGFYMAVVRTGRVRSK